MQSSGGPVPASASWIKFASERHACALRCCHHWWMASSVQRQASISSALTPFLARWLVKVVIQRATGLIDQVDGSFLPAHHLWLTWGAILPAEILGNQMQASDVS